MTAYCVRCLDPEGKVVDFGSGIGPYGEERHLTEEAAIEEMACLVKRDLNFPRANAEPKGPLSTTIDAGEYGSWVYTVVPTPAGVDAFGWVE